MCLLHVTCKCSLVERTISGGQLVTDLQFTVYQVKNCLTVQLISTNVIYIKEQITAHTPE